MSNVDYGRFTVAKDAEQRNIIWASQGPGGSGKTHFLLTAPDPIAIFLFDPAGLKGIVSKKEFRKKDVRVIDYSKKLNLGQYRKDEKKDHAERAAAALDVLNEFREDWHTALKFARTVGWDKEDHVWEMLRYACNEDYSAEPKSYYELNMEYRGWFTDAENAGVNMGVMRGVKEEWGVVGTKRDGRPSYGGLGTYGPRGQKEVTELVQVNLAHSWVNAEHDEPGYFSTKILDKCRLGNAIELIGTEHRNLDFLTLATELYPGVKPSAWGL